MLITGCQIAADDDSWTRFIATPSEKSFSLIKKNISSNKGMCDWGSDNNLILYPQQYRSPINDLTSTGNYFAFEIGLTLNHCLDGADLQDFFISSGMFFDSKPVDFFSLTQKYRISDRYISSMMLSLPSDTTDNLEAQYGILEARLIKLNRIESAIEISTSPFKEKLEDLLSSIKDIRTKQTIN